MTNNTTIRKTADINGHHIAWLVNDISYNNSLNYHISFDDHMVVNFYYMNSEVLQDINSYFETLFNFYCHLASQVNVGIVNNSPQINLYNFEHIEYVLDFYDDNRNRFKDSNSAMTYVMASLVIMRYCNIDWESAIDIAKIHRKYWHNRSIDTVEDFRMYVDPGSACRGHACYNMLHNFLNRNEYVSKDQMKVINNMDYLEVVNALYNIINYATDKDNCLNMMEYVPTYQNSNNRWEKASFNDAVNKLPIKTKSYRDYLRTKTVGDIRKLWGNVSNKLSHDMAVSVSDNILGRTSKSSEELMTIANESYNIIVNAFNFQCKTNGHKPNLSMAINQYVKYLNNLLQMTSNPDVVESVNAYLKTNKDSLTFDVVDNIMASFQYNPKVWVSTKDSANINNIVSALSGCMGQVEAIQTILAVTNNKTPLTMAQWSNFIRNNEQYRDCPVSWWVEVI